MKTKQIAKIKISMPLESNELSDEKKQSILNELRGTQLRKVVLSKKRSTIPEPLLDCECELENNPETETEQELV